MLHMGHTITKFISRIRNYDFILRDASRYHHFKDGNVLAVTIGNRYCYKDL